MIIRGLQQCCAVDHHEVNCGLGSNKVSYWSSHSIGSISTRHSTSRKQKKLTTIPYQFTWNARINGETGATVYAAASAERIESFRGPGSQARLSQTAGVRLHPNSQLLWGLEHLQKGTSSSIVTFFALPDTNIPVVVEVSSRQSPGHAPNFELRR